MSENTTALLNLPEKDEVTIGLGSYRYEYTTENSFEIDRFTEECKLSELLDDLAGQQLFREVQKN